MHYNNSFLGIRECAKFALTKGEPFLKLRSDLLITKPKIFLNEISRFLSSEQKFLAVDITSRNPSTDVLYHLSDWVFGVKDFSAIARLSNLEEIDERSCHEYWMVDPRFGSHPDFNQRLALEQYVWTAILNPASPINHISDRCELKMVEQLSLLSNIWFKNLSSIGLICVKYPNAHYPHFGRLRSSQFRHLREPNCFSFCLVTLDYLWILLFSVLRYIRASIKEIL